MRINNKQEMYAAYEAGRFGNRLRTWSSLDALLASDFQGSFTLRYRGETPGYFGLYNVTRQDVERRIAAVRTERPLDRARIMANESAPDERLVLQGEVRRSEFGLDLTYSTQKNTKMNVAMKNPSYATGLCANMLLQYALAPIDWDDLNELLDTYDDAVIEFSAYEIELGDCPHRKTIFWEVRSY